MRIFSTSDASVAVLGCWLSVQLDCTVTAISSSRAMKAMVNRAMVVEAGRQAPQLKGLQEGERREWKGFRVLWEGSGFYEILM